MIFLTTGQTILAFLRNCKLYLYMRYDMYTENKCTNHPHITHCLGDKLVKIWFKTNWGLVWRMTISLQREREREWVSEWVSVWVCVCVCVNEWVSVREREWVSECVCVCVWEREREGGGDILVMWHMCGITDMHTWFWWGNLNERSSWNA